MHCGLWPSFETRSSTAPQDEVPIDSQADEVGEANRRPMRPRLIVSGRLRETVTAGSSELQKTAYFSDLPRLTKRAGAGADRPRSPPIHRID
jgi:hypothetical protein